MVKAAFQEPPKINGLIDIPSWLGSLSPYYTSEDIQKIEAPLLRLRAQGESYTARGVGIASALVDLRLGISPLIAGILLPLYQEDKISAASISEQFDPLILQLLSGVKKMEAISALHATSGDDLKNEEQIDKLRKMLLAMVEDTRVVLIKLADHLFLLREAKHLPVIEQQAIALQTKDIYAPLANRLGVGKLKWEIEDLAFRYLEPQAYKTIATLLDERRADREEYIQHVITLLKSALEQDGICAKVNGRVKHIYSIWRKMQRKQLDYEEIYDVRALRIMVEKERDCYAALGTVHCLWQHIPKEFDDYIATPKENGYRSLHTAVIGPQGRTLEVQIRTKDMHRDSELGVASHWRYKEGSAHDPSYEKKIEWLRQLVDWQEEVSSAQEIIGELRTKVFEERVYILTPKGKVIDLPVGATPLDFAYAVHTEIGHRCRGAKVNGRMVPLTYALNTGDQVEILTAKLLAPSRDWLNPDAGYLITSRARAKVQTWFKKENRDDNIRAGRVILDREWRRLGIASVDLDKIAGKLNFSHGSDVLAALGGGDIRIAQVINAASETLLKPETLPESSLKLIKKKSKPGAFTHVAIEGVDNLLSHIAGCCKPVPGDKIIGYITQATGVSIHQVDCPNVLQVQLARPERLVEVTWAGAEEARYPVALRMLAQDRPGLLRDITAVLTQERIAITSLSSNTNAQEGTHDIQCVVEVASLDMLGRLIEKLSAIPYVVDVMRTK